MITIMNNKSLLARCVAVDRTEIRSQVSSRKKIFQSIAALLCSGLEGAVKEKQIYLQLWEREKLGNTCIGNGVALPHSRSEFVEEAVIAILTLDQAVDCDASDGQGVDLVFGILVPNNANEEHLKLLANIARITSDPQKKNFLCQATTAQDLIDKINKWSV